MSVVAVARKDFLDTTRTMSLWALVGLFLLVTIGIAVAYGLNLAQIAGPQGATGQGLMLFISGTMGLFVSIAAIVLCYKALAGERESGSVKLLLSLPHTRRDVVLGKLLGRGAAIGGAAGGSVLVAGVVGSALAGAFDPVALVVVAVVTAVFGFVYAGIMVGVSATTGSTSRAISLALGVFFVFELIWDVVPLAIVVVLNGFELPTSFPAWYLLLVQVPPSQAYSSTIVAAVPGLSDGAGAGAQVEGTEGLLEGLYASPEIGVVILAVWLLVPVAVGIRSFELADL